MTSQAGATAQQTLSAANSVQRTYAPQKLLLVQCFRGFAAFAVLLFHTAAIARERGGVNFFWKYFRAGATGVDFFFVLSGFVILWVHGKDIGQSNRVNRYGWRRFSRVYPMYAVCTLCVLALYIAGFGHTDKLNPGSIAKSFLLLPFPPGEHPIIGQGWTLAHEALFYFLFASFIVFGARWALGFGSLLLAGSIVSLILPFSGLAMPGPYWISHWILSPYNLEFAAGCGVALAMRNMRPERLKWCLPGGFLMLCSVWTVFSQDFGEVLRPDDLLTSKMILLFGTSYTLIAAGAVAWEGTAPVRPPKLLLGLGDATFSVYLTHFVVISGFIAILLRVFGAHSPLLPVALMGAVGLTAGFGYAVYVWFEKPMLDRLRKFETRGPASS